MVSGRVRLIVNAEVAVMVSDFSDQLGGNGPFGTPTLPPDLLCAPNKVNLKGTFLGTRYVPSDAEPFESRDRPTSG